jgi:predicted small metal-binding protein
MSLKAIGLTLALALALIVPLAAASAQDAPKKQAMPAAKMEKGPVMEMACPPECGFAVRGRDQKEITAMMKKHAKSAHKMTVTDEQCKSMMKEVPAK